MTGHLTLHALARALGGEVAGPWVRAPGPNHSRRDRSMWVSLAPEALDGFIVGSFSADDWQTCKDYVRERLGLAAFTPGRSERPSRPEVVALDHNEDAGEGCKRREHATAIWRSSVPISGTPAEAYLVSRGVPYHGEALRWHAACPFARDRVGCMVALVRNIFTNIPQGIHRTAIDATGRKLSHLGSNGDMAAAIASMKVVTRSLGNGEVEYVYEIKCRDKNSALEKISRHLGMLDAKLKANDTEYPLTKLLKSVQGTSLPVVQNPPDDDDDDN